MFRKTFFYSFFLLILFIPVSIFVTKVGVEILFPQYSNGILLLLLLPVCLTFAKALPVVIVNTGFITSTGHAKYMAIENVIVGTLNVILNLIVIRIYGYVGMVWVTLILQTVSMVVLYIVYYRNLKKYI